MLWYTVDTNSSMTDAFLEVRRDLIYGQHAELLGEPLERVLDLLYFARSKFLVARRVEEVADIGFSPWSGHHPHPLYFLKAEATHPNGTKASIAQKVQELPHQCKGRQTTGEPVITAAMYGIRAASGRR